MCYNLRMQTILVFRTDTTGLWREKLAGITAFAKMKGWRVQPIDARTRLSDLVELIDFWKPAGIILDASGDTRELDLRVFLRHPCVALTPSSDKVRHALPFVCSSPQEIAALAARELLRRDIRTLAFVDAPESPSWAITKRDAFRRIAKLHGFQLAVVTPREVVGLPQPIGLFAVSDNLAAETLVAAERAGLRVPEDLSVVGVDDNPEICENCEPTLTSVRPDFHQLGFAAAKTLQARIVSPHRKNESVEIPPVGLVRRASSGASEDACVSRALEKIRLQACEGLSVADVAALFGDCSRRSAELRFKAATGMTMTEALLEIRLSRASDYLKDGLSVSAVANFCGWKSDIPFRKAFKRKYGILPSDLRPTHRKRKSAQSERQSRPRLPYRGEDAPPREPCELPGRTMRD